MRRFCATDKVRNGARGIESATEQVLGSRGSDRSAPGAGDFHGRGRALGNPVSSDSHRANRLLSRLAKAAVAASVLAAYGASEVTDWSGCADRFERSPAVLEQGCEIKRQKLADFQHRNLAPEHPTGYAFRIVRKGGLHWCRVKASCAGDGTRVAVSVGAPAVERLRWCPDSGRLVPGRCPISSKTGTRGE